MLQTVSIPYMNKLNIMRRKENRLTQTYRVRTLDMLWASAYFLPITTITMINAIMITAAITTVKIKISELGESSSSSGSSASACGFCEASVWG